MKVNWVPQCKDQLIPFSALVTKNRARISSFIVLIYFWVQKIDLLTSFSLCPNDNGPVINCNVKIVANVFLTDKDYDKD